MGAVFRPRRETPADRSAGDRLRHLRKVRSAIRENIADIIAEEAIIGQSGDRIVKVPIRGIKEYRFVYGENNAGVAEGAGKDTQRGDTVSEKRPGSRGPGQAGNEPGVDYYETGVTIDELIDIMFEDLELPDLERKQLSAIESLRLTKRKGYRRVGLRVHLDKRRTVRAKIRRVQATRTARTEGARGESRVPFHLQDLRYRHRSTEVHRESNAVVICIMDTSGSMDTVKKYLARGFFFLLYQFVARRYENVEVVFISHDIEAREVSEEEFFHKGESGGTFVSSGYRKALEIIAGRYHPDLWNIYAFHCSDGDNFASDTPAAITAVGELCAVANLFGYGEIKPRGAGFYGSSLIDTYKKIGANNFQAVLIERKQDVWPRFRSFLQRDRDQDGCR